MLIQAADAPIVAQVDIDGANRLGGAVDCVKREYQKPIVANVFLFGVANRRMQLLACHAYGRFHPSHETHHCQRIQLLDDFANINAGYVYDYAFRFHRHDFHHQRRIIQLDIILRQQFLHVFD